MSRLISRDTRAWRALGDGDPWTDAIIIVMDREQVTVTCRIKPRRVVTGVGGGWSEWWLSG